MNRMHRTTITVIALAYFHRYGWIAAMIGCIMIWPDLMYPVLCAGCLIFSIWSFIGYKCKWKHIYCSFQNAYRQEMTPHSIRWHQIKKSDAYGLPVIFFVFSLAVLILILLN